MPNEHFCLKWNNFQRNIVAALGNLKLDEDFESRKRQKN